MDIFRTPTQYHTGGLRSRAPHRPPRNAHVRHGAVLRVAVQRAPPQLQRDRQHNHGGHPALARVGAPVTGFSPVSFGFLQSLF